METCNSSKPLFSAAVLLSTCLFWTPSHAGWVDIGNGLIYDDVSNVTWTSDGYAFTNNIASTTTFNPTGNPYMGPLLGTVVTPSLGAPHAVAANDFSYDSGLGRWVGSWWAATAWADGFSYQYGSQTVSDWRLPTTAEAQNLITQIGAGNWGVTGPFAWVPPFFWTSDLTSATNVNVARPLFGEITNLTLINPVNGGPRYSNVWAVVSGNVAAVPAPATAWLLGIGAVAWLGTIRRRQTRVL